jgi:hypothetical protein
MRGYLTVMYSEKECCNVHLFSGLTNAVGRSLTDRLKFSACQEQALLGNTERQLHRRLSLGQWNLAYTFTLYIFEIQFNIILPSLCSFTAGLRFCKKRNGIHFLVLFVHAICPTYHILLDFMALLIFAEGCNCEAPHYAVFSTLLSVLLFSVKIFSSPPCSEMHSLSLSMALQPSEPFPLF